MLALVNVLLQHRCKDLGHLRDLQSHCTECTVRKQAGAISDPRLGEVSPGNLSLARHSLSKKRHQLMKLRMCISHALRKDVQKHTSLLQVYRKC